MVLYVSIVVIIIASTRFLAYFGIYFLKPSQIPLIENVLNLTYVENTGAAFGIFKNATTMLSVFGIIFFIMITYLVASKKFKGNFYTICFAVLAGGGISNVCDRFTFGFVVDYIDFALINYPVFNLADICVVVSCFLLATKIIFSKDGELKNGHD